MESGIRLEIDWRSASQFTLKSFLSLILVLGVYALVKRNGSILSLNDIRENYIYILGIYVAINLLSLVAMGSIKLSSNHR